MNRTRILIAALLFLLGSFAVTAQPSGRSSFNKGWSMVHNFDRDKMLSDYQTENHVTKTDLPHDWGVKGPFNQEWDGSTGKLGWWGYARYWKDFEISEKELDGKNYRLELDGAMARPTVYCNDEYVGEWAYGYSSFILDITPFLKAGNNRLMIELDNQNGSSRWYPGGGIYRNVWLTVSDPVGIGNWGTYITTSVKEGKALVKVVTTLRNSGGTAISGKLSSTIFKKNPSGQMLKVGETISTDVDGIYDGQQLVQEMEIQNPELWSMDNPQLYSMESILEAGTCKDSYTSSFGIREISFTKDGFFLNGEKTRLNGVCLHHDSGALGAVWNRGAWVRRLRMLKRMGCNAIRSTHNPPAPELLELCDEMGFAVINEFTDTWTIPKTPNGYAVIFDEWAEKDLVSMIHRDRNHPCIVLWSIGNEIGEQGYPEKYHIASELSEICHREDPTRMTTAGCDNLWASTQEWRNCFDVYGFNYKPRAYGDFREANPEKPYYGSETASTISSRSTYVFPVSADKAEGKQDFQVSSYDLYAPAWATDPDTEFTAQDKYPWVAGEFVWTGFDYIGEPTPYNWDMSVLTNFHDKAQREKAERELAELGKIRVPSRSSYFGIIDLAGFPKDRYWIYQARWRPELPMAHILPHWNWEGREGQVTPVMVYTSGDSAELFINGKSQGLKTKGEYEYRLRWDDVVYESGTVKVVAYKNGKVWAKDQIRTSGPATKIAVAAELGEGPGKDFGGDKAVKNSKRTLRIKAKDFQQTGVNPEYLFIDIKIADKRGRMVPTANNLLKITVDGPAKLIAADAGDAASHVPFFCDKLSAFNGLCSAIIQPDGGKGKITVTVEGYGLKSGKMKIVMR